MPANIALKNIDLSAAGRHLALIEPQLLLRPVFITTAGFTPPTSAANSRASNLMPVVLRNQPWRDDRHRPKDLETRVNSVRHEQTYRAKNVGMRPM